MKLKSISVLGVLREAALVIQHLVLVLPVTLAVPAIFGSSIGLNQVELRRMTQMTLLCAGILTILFSTKLSKEKQLNLVIGADMILLAIGIKAASHMTLSAYFGVLVIGAGISYVMGHYTKLWLKWLTPPILVASIGVYCLGFLPVAMDWMMGGVGSPDFGIQRNVLIGSAVIVFTIFLVQYGKGFIKAGAIGLGIVFGFAMSVPMGLLDLTSSAEVPLFQLPSLFVVKPVLDLAMFQWLLPILLLLLIKQIMDIQVYTRLQGLNDEKIEEAIGTGMKRFSIGMLLSVVTGAVGLSASQPNMGFSLLMPKQNGVSTKMTGLVMVLLSLSPVVTSIVSLTPLPVVGGISIILIATLLLQTLNLCQLFEWKQKDLQIIAFSITFGILAMLKPDNIAIFSQNTRLLLESGLGVTFITGLILQVIIPEY